MLAHCSNSPEQQVQLQKEEHGKLCWNFPLHFNLSHSGEWIVAAFSFLSEIGIDIECRKRTPRMESIVRHFFHPDEIETWCSTSDTEQKTLFFQYWTMKEALLKATGDGLYASTKDFCLKPKTHSATIWYADHVNHQYDSWLLETFPTPEDYTGSVAYRVRKN
jgi:4'-phosphopantetheinyl transferase